MAKSRRALLLAIGLVAAVRLPAQGAPAADPAAAIEADQRSTVRRAMGLECPPADEAGDIVVCGSREVRSRRYRIDPGLAVQGEGPGSERHHQQAMAAGSSRCTAIGRDQACNRGLVLMGTGADKGVLGKIMGPD